MTVAIDDGAGEGPTAPLNEETAAVANIHLDSDGAPLAQHSNMSSWTKRYYEKFLG